MKSWIFRTFSVWISVVSLLVLQGCDGIGSVEGVVAKAGRAVQEGRLKSFRESLQGKALEQYGNPLSMSTLRAYLANYSHFKVQRLRELGRVSGPHGDIFNTYEVAVFGQGSDQRVKRLLELVVECQTEYYFEPAACTQNPPVGGPWNPPATPMPGDPNCWMGQRRCAIMDIDR